MTTIAVLHTLNNGRRKHEEMANTSMRLSKNNHTKSCKPGNETQTAANAET